MEEGRVRPKYLFAESVLHTVLGRIDISEIRFDRSINSFIYQGFDAQNNYFRNIHETSLEPTTPFLRFHLGERVQFQNNPYKITDIEFDNIIGEYRFELTCNQDDRRALQPELREWRKPRFRIGDQIKFRRYGHFHWLPGSVVTVQYNFNTMAYEYDVMPHYGITLQPCRETEIQFDLLE